MLLRVASSVTKFCTTAISVSNPPEIGHTSALQEVYLVATLGKIYKFIVIDHHCMQTPFDQGSMLQMYTDCSLPWWGT